MEVDSYIELSQLFDSIGIIEKGIEKLYHFLLRNKKIDNLKEVCEKYDLTLKRGYKITSVLSDLELVQIYDRPMKIHLASPILPIWQKIINSRIQDLATEFQEKKIRCEDSFDGFLGKYNLKDEETPEPVEFVKYDVNNFEELYYPVMTRNSCKLALGIHYENPLISLLHSKVENDIPDIVARMIKPGMLKLVDNVAKISIRAIFHKELLTNLLASNEFKLLSSHVEHLEVEFKDFQIHVTEEQFSNFSLTDSELIQPSFDPTHVLLGAYISRNKNIYQIFNEKFLDLYEKGISIEEFLNKEPNLAVKALTKKQQLVLCLL